MITVSINKEMMELYLCFKNIFCHIDFWSRDLNFCLFFKISMSKTKDYAMGFHAYFMKFFLLVLKHLTFYFRKK